MPFIHVSVLLAHATTHEHNRNTLQKVIISYSNLYQGHIEVLSHFFSKCVRAVFESISSQYRVNIEPLSGDNRVPVICVFKKNAHFFSFFFKIIWSCQKKAVLLHSLLKGSCIETTLVLSSSGLGQRPLTP